LADRESLTTSRQPKPLYESKTDPGVDVRAFGAMVPHLVRYGQTSPAISEDGGGLDFAEGRVNFAEFLTDALDRRSNVGPIAQLPMSGRETFVVLKVVNFAIGPVETDIRRQKMDDVEFTESKVNVDLAPIGSADARPENELAAHNSVVGLRMGDTLARLGHDSEPPDQNLYAPRLVDEVDRALSEGLFFLLDLGVARQEHYRQVYAALAQPWKEVNSCNVRKAPIEDQ